jgi:hypothetical protein
METLVLHKKIVKFTSHFLIITFITCCFFTARLVQAQKPLPEESGFSGYLELLGAYRSTNSQLNTDNKNEKTDSLDKSGKRVAKFMPLPLGLIAYTFSELRTQLFLGVRPEAVVQGQFQVEAGVRHDLSDGTLLRASAIPVTPFEKETWEDPFVVDLNRKESDITSYGFKLAAENIRTSGIGFEYRWIEQKIDKEKSGTFLIAQPGSQLTAEDLDDLKRDSKSHRLSAEYSFELVPRTSLKPILRYTREDADGRANSFHALTTQLSFSYFGDQFRAFINGVVKREWFDATHPVFNKTRRDFNLGLFAILGYKDPLGFKNFRIDWLTGFFMVNSNINFYESTNYITALGIAYIF